MDKKVAEYLASVTPPERVVLENIRNVVVAVVPDATEVWSYGMPGFKYKGSYLIGYAAFKDHLSLFPTPGPIEKLAGKLTDYKTAKGTIQFTGENPITDKLIIELVKNRVEQIQTKYIKEII